MTEEELEKVKKYLKSLSKEKLKELEKKLIKLKNSRKRND